MTVAYPDFETHALDDDGHQFFVGQLPESLRPDATGFEELWRIRPDRYYIIHMYGRPVETPRWQQAYDVDYHWLAFALVRWHARRSYRPASRQRQ